MNKAARFRALSIVTYRNSSEKAYLNRTSNKKMIKSIMNAMKSNNKYLNPILTWAVSSCDKFEEEVLLDEASKTPLSPVTDSQLAEAETVATSISSLPDVTLTNPCASGMGDRPLSTPDSFDRSDGKRCLNEAELNSKSVEDASYPTWFPIIRRKSSS